jgi:plastocyanin
MEIRPVRLALALLVLVPLGVRQGDAQETLERTPNLSGGWTGQTGTLYANLPFRFHRGGTPGDGLVGVPTFDLGLGLPGRLLGGGRLATQSPVVPGRPTEWELFVRRGLAEEARGAPLDLAFHAAFNGTAGSADAELSLARWAGPLRLLGAARAMSDGYRAGEPRFALAAGAVLHPAAGSLPVALAVDAASLLDRRGGERLGWSAALQIGVGHTANTLSIFTTNTASSTLQGASRGEGRTRFGFELTVPVPAGHFLGWFAPRQQARAAVSAAGDEVEPHVRAETFRFLFSPRRIEIPVGGVVEWVNRDRVVHTVTAEDGAWDSGAIRPGERWRARFDRPGLYPFLCGPHPYMRGVVVVR